MQTIYCLMGPTASGKTSIALQLAEAFPFEIISVDSALVYKEMDIGTAKPTSQELQRIPHHLISIRDPALPYSAASFCIDANQSIVEILQRKKTPLLVGGTMLYFKALQNGLAAMPSADEAMRKEIEKVAEQNGWQYWYDYLKKVDPKAAARINPNDRQRLQRAIEVYQITGRSLSSMQANHDQAMMQYQFINIGLIPEDRQLLHDRIEKRFHQMLEQGFIEEVKRLFSRNDLTEVTPSIRSVGYRQVWEYLQNKLSYQEMIDKGIAATRQLAKRQLTWLRSWPNLHIFAAEHPQVYEKIKLFITINYKRG